MENKKAQQIESAIIETEKSLEAKISNKIAEGKNHRVSSEKLEALKSWRETTLRLIIECANDKWWAQFSPDFIEVPVRSTRGIFGEGLACLWVSTPGDCGENNRWAK